MTTPLNTDQQIENVERLLNRFRNGDLSRRGFLGGLFAAGLTGTAVSALMAGEARAAATEGVAEAVWDGKVFDAQGESVTLSHWGGEIQDFAMRTVIKEFEIGRAHV